MIRLSVPGSLALCFCLLSPMANALTPGMYEVRDASYPSGQHGSELEAANAFGELRCGGGGEMQGLDRMELHTRYDGPDPGTEGITAKYNTYCVSEGYDNGRYVQRVSVTYSNPPSCPSGQEWNSTTQQCQEVVEPEDCFEMGQVYDPATEQCTLNCPNGQMDSQCLTPPDECTPDRPDYMGRIGAGNVAICGDDLGACGSGTAGIVNGTVTCISNDYGPPTLCPPGSISRFDGYGFTCDSLPEGTENPQWANGPPNVDTNGDGAPDAYDPSLDGGSAYHAIKNIFNQNSVVINQNNITNNNLTSIDNAIKEGNKENANGLEGIAGALGDLASGIGGMASDLGALKQMGENGELAGGGGAGDGTTEIVGEDGNAITWSGESINTELTDPTENYDQVMSDYQAKINQIKGEVQAMFSTSLTGGGSVDDNIKSIRGVDVNFSLNRFLSGLDILGAIVLFCAAFISAGILFSGRG